MVTLRKVESRSDRKEIKKIFLEAFPPEERPPYRILCRKARKETVGFDGVYDGDKLVGMTYVVKGYGIAYVFFLAIKHEERGSGYGSQALKLLKEKYKDSRLFLALEQQDETAKNYSQRKKRHEFYQRCGLVDMPYRIKEGTVVYDVMGTGGEVSPDEYKRLIEDYLGKIMSRFVDMRFMNK